MDLKTVLDDLREVPQYDIDLYSLNAIWCVGFRLSEIPSDDNNIDDNDIREKLSSQHGPHPPKYGGPYEVSMPSLYMRTEVTVPLPFPSAEHVAKWLKNKGSDEDVYALEQCVTAVCNGTKAHCDGYRFEWAGMNYNKYFQGMLAAKIQADLVQRNIQLWTSMLQDQCNVIKKIQWEANMQLNCIDPDDIIKAELVADFPRIVGRPLPEGNPTDDNLSIADNIRHAQSLPNPNDI